MLGISELLNQANARFDNKDVPGVESILLQIEARFNECTDKERINFYYLKIRICEIIPDFDKMNKVALEFLNWA